MNTEHAMKVLAEAKAIKAEIERLNGELAARNTILASEVNNNTGKVELPNGTFTVSENNTYPEANIRALLSPGQVKRCEVRKLDNSVVKALYPAVYAAAKKNNGVKVSIG